MSSPGSYKNARGVLNAKRTHNELIPMKYQHRILNVRGAGDAEFWTLGDVAAELEAKAADSDEARALRNAIADMAGVTAKTICEYKAHAEYYPTAVRNEYPNLTRWHFRFAKAAGTLKESRRWLKLAEDSADEYQGNPMPVRVLQAKMAEAAGKTEPPTTLPPLAEAFRVVVDAVSDLAERDDLPEPARVVVAGVADALRAAMGMLVGPLTKVQ